MEEEVKPDPVKERIREFIKGKDLGTLVCHQVYGVLYPDQVSARRFEDAWRAVTAEIPGTEKPTES